ncbi:FxDxF family PEP-CTERM protein [Rhodoferax fermentans]|uniref:Ice-binding protein C-terminal domain-containing protein n=1 Tax=Rhodoferax fermentans TaxID=28066 RepID=A0A1T1AUE9_RHOFE|nr:FxDxF family PEP-CTERM protein [Rhodoferax fermentans]MBK1682881.1 hypothetical protein [Rhodoferax fermentans]OOV07734.1 hypothetical protein RF819_14300 [Rhodoferax fermentans]
MKTTQLLKSIAVATALVGASLSASAATQSLGPLVAGQAKAFSGYAPVGAFADTITFSLPTNSGSGYSVIDFATPNNVLHTVFTAISLFYNPDGVIGGNDSLVASSVSTNNELSLTLGSLAAGSYYLNIYGSTVGTLGGGYSGAISVTPFTAPVPEPETFAMLLAGLGVMGAIARRRKI